MFKKTNKPIRSSSAKPKNIKDNTIPFINKYIPKSYEDEIYSKKNKFYEDIIFEDNFDYNNTKGTLDDVERLDLLLHQKFSHKYK